MRVKFKFEFKLERRARINYSAIGGHAEDRNTRTFSFAPPGKIAFIPPCRRSKQNDAPERFRPSSDPIKTTEPRNNCSMPPARSLPKKDSIGPRGKKSAAAPA